ncbi:hypothetical protein BC939DRAFT_503316 [Gamsiella multidivaricata]|uniref:uncharacterized protein n=1 Tax=Gamsiella multidivaricata TaxID=101098 RepID=UPI00221FE22D|nr:uncharacterized protein BC939DRAFT_503316 [Gamsiella multidivaricata]KAG0367610.1 hypothetical protein BGZ54_003609 [Gamsiella multidivaricata]KAI7823391.1 hypothetical protein BC939DRAFT_503316 [Gamsiella multidivaricata]
MAPTTEGYAGTSTTEIIVTGALAVIVAAASPIIAASVVGAVGFGAGGIVAGTPAAAIMATYGGTVGVGSACAVLQSVGAAGLGVFGTTFVSALGAATVAAGAAGASKLTAAGSGFASVADASFNVTKYVFSQKWEKVAVGFDMTGAKASFQVVRTGIANAPGIATAFVRSTAPTGLSKIGAGLSRDAIAAMATKKRAGAGVDNRDLGN